MSIVVDRPPAEPDLIEPPPTEAQRGRQWWRWWFPWVKTAVSAPADDESLTINNATDEAWVLTLGYRALGTIPPRDTQRFNVLKRGLLCALQSGAPTGTGYLTLRITPSVSMVQIAVTELPGENLYGLCAINRPTTSARLSPKCLGIRR